MRLDPWQDAARLARALEDDDTELILVLGAEAWCHKCRSLRPRFDAFADVAPPHRILLWLDVDEHAPFLGDYLPEDLPELLIYRAGTLTGRAHLAPADSLEGLLAQARPSMDAPGLWSAFVRADWAC